MKATMFVVTLFFVNSWCYYNPNKKRPTTTKAPITTYYINNWYNYRMPSEISVESLRTILELVAKYREEEYCPFGDFEDCDDKNLKEVVDKIILDIITAEKMKLDASAQKNSTCDMAVQNKTSLRSLAMCMAKYNYLREKNKPFIFLKAKNSKLKKTSQESMEISDEDLSGLIDFDYVNERKHKGKHHKKHGKKSHKKRYKNHEGDDEEAEINKISYEDLIELTDFDDENYKHKHSHKKHRKKHKKHHRHHKSKENDDEEKKHNGSAMFLSAYVHLKVRKHPNKLVNMRDVLNPATNFGNG